MQANRPSSSQNNVQSPLAGPGVPPNPKPTSSSPCLGHASPSSSVPFCLSLWECREAARLAPPCSRAHGHDRPGLRPHALMEKKRNRYPCFGPGRNTFWGPGQDPPRIFRSPARLSLKLMEAVWLKMSNRLMPLYSKAVFGIDTAGGI